MKNALGMKNTLPKGMLSVPNANTGISASNNVKGAATRGRPPAGRPVAATKTSKAFSQSAAKGGGSIAKDAKASSDIRAQFYAKGKGATGKKASLLD